MRLLSLLVVVALASAALAAPFNAHYWTKGARAAPSAVHSVVFMPRSKPDALATCDSMLMEVSTPGLPKYGQHLSFNQVGERFRNRWSETRVLNLIRRAGVPRSAVRMTPHGEFIRVTTTVALLEKLLPGARFFAFAHNATTIYRDLDYTLPAALHRVASVTDVNYLPTPPTRVQFQMSTARSLGDGNVSPSLLNSFYQISSNVVRSSGATQALFESLGQSFDPNDLIAFQQQYNLPQTPIAKILGPNQPSTCSDPDNCIEASLDVQWILAIAQNATTWYWSIPGNGDIFVQWAEAVAATPNPPLIHSISYGSLAPEDPKHDILQFNLEMCKLGLKGLTLFVASGDDGVANFGARGNPDACGFTPSFPATSPYATAVGATMGPETNSPEVVCTSNGGGLITSGGGFSTYVKRPAWQDAVVDNYLNNGPNMPPRTMFSSLGRAYPDIAVMGHNYVIAIGGSFYVGSGTSAASPVAAGMFTLINGMRMSRGKSPLGFLNPALYQQGAAKSPMFNDITVGTNNCCAGQPGTETCCQYGFTATTGWDATSGFGSINFAQATKILASL